MQVSKTARLDKRRLIGVLALVLLARQYVSFGYQPGPEETAFIGITMTLLLAARRDLWQPVLFIGMLFCGLAGWLIFQAAFYWSIAFGFFGWRLIEVARADRERYSAQPPA